MEPLYALGWSEALTAYWQKLGLVGVLPGRVVADFGTSLKVATPSVLTAELTGKLAHHSNREHTPKVGDWVAVRVSDNGNAVIEATLPRRSEFARKVAGKRTVKQVIAANVDIAFVLLALDADFSIERLQRYLYQLAADNIEPIIVLNKADKTDDVQAFTDRLSDIPAQVIISSALQGTGIDTIRNQIAPGQTAVLLGSSGVGKSTITNQLLGTEVQRTQAVRASDSTGKHTTVHRELFVLPNGGLLIDTPGIREIQLWGTEEDLDKNFAVVADIAATCKYRNCQHQDEAGCAVLLAINKGTLSRSQLSDYSKLKAELAGLRTKSKVRTQSANRRSYKNIKRQDADTLHEMYDEAN